MRRQRRGAEQEQHQPQISPAEVGHSVAVAADGAEALDILARADGPFDLLLADIVMPVMDGIEMAKKAAAVYPGLKILLMTGYAEQRERAAELSPVIVDVIQKPFTLAEIRQSIARAITGRAFAAAH